MRTITVVAIGFVFLASAWMIGNQARANVESNDNNVAVMDDCLPSDPAWEETGGCTLKPHQGDVSFAEFQALLLSPLSPTVVGHPSWRNEPSYLAARVGKRVRVTNKGGRGHTFTEVLNFGGGFVPPLNGAPTPLAVAPECNPVSPTLRALNPGTTVELDLTPGLHRFQCCIHPWMRAAVRVE
jgi:plastocyanin